MQTLDSLDAFNLTIRGRKPAIIEFQSTTCPHCKVLSPTLESLANQYGDELDFRLVDVEATPDIASAANVLTTPTTIVYSQGSQAAILKGALPRSLIGMIEATVDGLREANSAVLAGPRT